MDYKKELIRKGWIIKEISTFSLLNPLSESENPEYNEEIHIIVHAWEEWINLVSPSEKENYINLMYERIYKNIYGE